jgi:hypothetical protein
MCSFASGVNATPISVAQRGLSIIGNVAGVDTSKYAVSITQPQQFLNVTGVNEQAVIYTMQSVATKLNVSCVFAGDKLHMLYVLGSEGSPEMTKTNIGGVKNLAQNYLSGYATYTKNSLFTDLSNSLSSVDVSKNSTVSKDDYKLQVNAVSADVGYTTFSWIYTFNGIDAPEKSIAIGYQNGTLKYFVDSWSIYSIGSTDLKLSEKDAVAIALQSARSYSYQTGSGKNATIVKDLNVTCVKDIELLFCDSSGADNPRCADSLTLYPMWRVGVGLDKWYPGNVYGIYVDIWADTGQVSQVQEVFSTLPPDYVDSANLFDSSASVSLNNQESRIPVESNSTLMMQGSIFVGLAICVFGFVFVGVKLKGKAALQFKGLPKISHSKIIAGFFSLILICGVFLVPISMVNAETRRALIFGDESYGYPGSKPLAEVQAQIATASNLYGMFDAGGYSSDNFQGSGTTNANVLYQVAASSEGWFNKTAAVYFDHGIGDWLSNDWGNWHYCVYSNDPSGIPIYDEDIYDATGAGLGKINFALISTCMSANLTYGQGFYPSPSVEPRGMPFAWTHRGVVQTIIDLKYNMSDDGYGNPDGGDQCYIGFPWGSPALSQPIDSSFPYRTYGDWLYAFFWYALYNDISVNSALDEASLMMFNTNFGSSSFLGAGYNPCWGTPWGMNPPSTMAVYGNGGIHLYYCNPNLPLTPSVYIYAGGYVAEFGQHWYINVPFNIGGVDFDSYDGVEIYPNFLPRGIYWVNLPDSVEVFDTTMYLVDVAGHNYTVLPFMIDCSSGTVILEADYGFQLNFSSTTGGSTDLVGAHRYLGGEDQTVNVTATPDYGYVLDYWLMNGDYAGANPTLTVTLVDSYDVQAVFCPVGYETRFSLTVAGLHWFWNTPVDDAVYIDGQYVGQTNNEFYVCPGSHLVSVATASELIFRFEDIDHEQQNSYIIANIDETNSPMTLTVRYYYG